MGMALSTWYRPEQLVVSLPELSLALMQRFQLPLEDWVRVEPLAKEVVGEQLLPVVQQYLVEAIPEGSEAVTVTLALVLDQEREVGLKVMVGAEVSQSLGQVDTVSPQLQASSPQWFIQLLPEHISVPLQAP